MRVVLDTNVFISALIFGGKPALVLRWFNRPGPTLLLTDHILSEVERILRAKSGWDQAFIAEVIGDLICVAEWVRPTLQVSACRDPDDNRILEAALAGAADFIVSGDADLLSMSAFRGIPIVSVTDFLARLDPTEAT